MEANARWAALTAIAPIAWGTTYYVTRHTLPADYPFYGGAGRALPAGLLLLLITRRLPKGSWWWRSVVLGAINFGAFFTLIYATAQLLPASVASTLMATSSVMMMLLAWPLLGERPQVLSAIGAAVGIGGVALMLLGDPGSVDYRGVVTSLAAMTLSCLGAILTTRWSPSGSILALTSWQLIAGGLLILPVAVVLEGTPPALTPERLAGYGYTTFVATALAFVVWFQGLRRLAAGTVGLIGLLNPVAGVLVGVLVGSEAFGAKQALGVLLVVGGILLGQPLVRRRFRAPALVAPEDPL
ncbi:DMT family transporter [Kineosporia succinea]|uniref:Blue pigment (Indigoidine) exporter n=1 Tax=Kineosporia succinea TaxID=84632 RepID=A0ABT9NXJ1_9ACTN|nr:DMT family transporter [Kineosporia succinea]MDP9825046.1 putative blue pigment (indigoidine) exporter [Kineosporia succinea]